MSDFEECWKIFYSVFERHEDEIFLTAWKSMNPALSFVIEINDETIAFLLTRETHIEFIGVAKEHQGKSLGTILLHSLLEACGKTTGQCVLPSSEFSDEGKINRCKRGHLSISLVPSNSDPKLIRWYEKNGFIRTNTFINKKEQLMIFSSSSI